MLDNLLKKRIIELLEPKRPEEPGKVTDPKYYRYHRVIVALLRNASCTLFNFPRMGG